MSLDRAVFFFNTPETDNKSKCRYLGSDQTKNNQKNEQSYRQERSIWKALNVTNSQKIDISNILEYHLTAIKITVIKIMKDKAKYGSTQF